MNGDAIPAIGAGLGLVAIAVLAWASVSQAKHEADLISGGSCKVSRSDMYQPPAAMVCAGYGKYGCTTWIPIQADPYMLDLWACAGGETFWRRRQ